MEENKIPTSKEILKNSQDFFGVRVHLNDDGISERYTLHAMREFAKLHVKAALKEAIEKVILEDSEFGYVGVCKDSILNAYPESNIK